WSSDVCSSDLFVIEKSVADGLPVGQRKQSSVVFDVDPLIVQRIIDHEIVVRPLQRRSQSKGHLAHMDKIGNIPDAGELIGISSQGKRVWCFTTHPRFGE